MTEREYQMVVDRTRKRIGYRRSVRVSVRHLKCGLGFPKEQMIMMPYWIEEYDAAYQMYYVLHELCHCIIGVKHSKTFKLYENVLLALWDIRIVRRTAYPKKVLLGGVECKDIPRPKKKRVRLVRKTHEEIKKVLRRAEAE